ncbi:MAG: hypothetical protein LBD80_07720 [Tannerella sp.]|jgi:hypothetical protein|nr:hypothetical protein [Tannerella sp.]
MNTPSDDKYKIFDEIFENFVKDVENKFTVNWNLLFFNRLKNKVLVNEDEKCIFKFLKYFNIWNVASDKGKIAFYGDFIHSEKDFHGIGKKKKFTTDRNEILIGSGEDIFNTEKTETIGLIFRTNKVFDEVYEFSFNSELITSSEYHTHIEENNNYVYDSNLREYLEKDDSLKPKFIAWLNALKSCYTLEENEDNNVTHFFFLVGPVFFGSIEEEKLQPYVVTANIGIECDMKNTEQKKEIQIFLKQLKIFINKLTFFVILRIKEENTIQIAVRASLAQVMARNLSHNIGSHVLVKVVNLIKNTLFYNLQIYNHEYCQCLAGQNKEKNSQNFDELIQAVSNVFNEVSITLNNFNASTVNGLNDKISIALSELKSNKFHGLEDIITLINYIKVRFDYIGDITTGTPVMETSATLGDIMDGFLKNRLLVDTISGIENFYYKFEYDDDSKNKIFAIPGDVLGNHAFYTILENLIRNLVKHGSVATTKTSPVIIQLKVEDIPECQDGECKEDDVNEMLAVSIIIKNNITGNTKIKKNNQGDDEDTDIWVEDKEEGTKEINNIDWLVHKQNRQINKSVIDRKSNTLRQRGWGLLEMEASATYLRKIPMEEIEHEEYTVPLYKNEKREEHEILTETDSYFIKEIKNEKRLGIFRAYKRQENEKNYLAYRFFAYKPREVLIVGDDKDIFGNGVSSTHEEKKKELLKHGIKIISSKDFLNENEINNENHEVKPLPLKKIYPHRLVVNYTDLDLSNNPALSRRIVVPKSGVDGVEKITKTEWKDIIYDCWIMFVEESKKIGVDDEGPKETDKKYLKYYEGCSSSHNELAYWTIKNNKYKVVERSSTTPWNVKEGGDFGRKAEKEIFLNIIRGLNCCVRIKVIDERIQSHAIGEQYKAKWNKAEIKLGNPEHIDYYTLYQFNNIFVPVTKEYKLQEYKCSSSVKAQSVYHSELKINLNEQNFDNNYSDIIKYINEDIKNTDFVVIHLSILEKMIKSYKGAHYDDTDKKGVENFIRDIVFKEVAITDKQDYYDRIVVISGRGKPNNLPDNIRYLNFSVVQQYMTDRQHKFPLTEAIYSARKLTSK